jgi:hypothetical protein
VLHLDAEVIVIVGDVTAALDRVGAITLVVQQHFGAPVVASAARVMSFQ